MSEIIAAPAPRRARAAGGPAQRARAALRNVLRRARPRDERETRERWLLPMLTSLGYRRRELPASDGGAPAWLLEARGSAPVVFLGRRRGRALDRLGAARGGDLYRSTNPEFSLWRALGNHGSGWGVLSEGLRWRLYHRSSGLHAWLELRLRSDSDLEALVKLFSSRGLTRSVAGATPTGRSDAFQRYRARAGSKRLGGSAGLPWEGLGADPSAGAWPWESLAGVVGLLSAGGARALADPQSVARVCWIGMGGLRLALLLGGWVAHRLVLEDGDSDRVAAELRGDQQDREFDAWLRAVYERLFVGLPGGDWRRIELLSGRHAWSAILLRRAGRGDPMLGSAVEELVNAAAAQQEQRADLFGTERGLELDSLRRDLSLWGLLVASMHRERSERRLRRALERTRDLLDLWLAHRRFGRPSWSELRWLLLGLHGSDARWRDLLGLPELHRVLLRIRRLEPLHWELEFPQVFHPARGAAGFRAVLAEAGPRADLAPPYARGLEALMRRLQPRGWLWVEAAPRSEAAVWRAARRIAAVQGGACRRPARRWVLLQRPAG
ncbi:MAG TPA: hypothetical protein VGB99_10350 [Acidobacteriota bacterium]